MSGTGATTEFAQQGVERGQFPGKCEAWGFAPPADLRPRRDADNLLPLARKDPTDGQALAGAARQAPPEADREAQSQARRAARQAARPERLHGGEVPGPEAVREAAAQLLPDPAQAPLLGVGTRAQQLPEVRDLSHRDARARAQRPAPGHAQVELVRRRP